MKPISRIVRACAAGLLWTGVLPGSASRLTRDFATLQYGVAPAGPPDAAEPAVPSSVTALPEFVVVTALGRRDDDPTARGPSRRPPRPARRGRCAPGAPDGMLTACSRSSPAAPS